MLIAPWHPAALLCLIVFFLSYVGVLMEERLRLIKSKPVMLGAALIWLIIALTAPTQGITHEQLHEAVNHGLGEYGALLLFLLSAMTFIGALQERRVFDFLNARLVRAGLNLRQIFWITGLMAFFLSPLADNLTTALVVGAIVLAVGRDSPRFIVPACVNIVNSANAGGAFSPFGDITTLMVWQAGKVDFFEFFSLFVPSLACFLIPAAIMSFFVPRDKPPALAQDIHLRRGAKFIMFLGLATIATAVVFEQFLGLPAFMGMMAGLSALMMTAHFIGKAESEDEDGFDIFKLLSRIEWDTLLFFFGVMFCVSGLAFIGYMEIVSRTLYEGWGPDVTNIAMGQISAIIDNIPIMFAVLTMNPEMSHFHWLLITLTTGIGGSLLSVGSAAGVALMGLASKQYTFTAHLKWLPVLALGYAAAIAVHYLLNGP